MRYNFYVIKNNRLKLISVMSVGIAVTFLFISPIVNSAFASPATAMPNQTLTQNASNYLNDGT
jgi:hypothetical protein